MLVVGGYNSSNTCNLARICAERVPTFHIADPDCLVSADEIRHRPVGRAVDDRTAGGGDAGWLPAAGPVTVGLTAGASTPNNIVGQVIERLARYACVDLAATLLSQNLPPRVARKASSLPAIFWCILNSLQKQPSTGPCAGRASNSKRATTGGS